MARYYKLILRNVQIGDSTFVEVSKAATRQPPLATNWRDDGDVGIDSVADGDVMMDRSVLLTPQQVMNCVAISVILTLVVLDRLAFLLSLSSANSPVPAQAVPAILAAVAYLVFQHVAAIVLNEVCYPSRTA